MTVIQFPRPDDEPTGASKPNLIALAPEGYVRRDQWMGLTEAIAWVGSRDKCLSDAAYYYLHERQERRRDDSFPLWYLLRGDLAEHYDADVSEAVAEVMASGLAAVGRFRGGSWEPMDALLWIAVTLAFDDTPDSICPADIRESGKPLWSHIRFKRDDVLKMWPVPAKAKRAKPRHPSSLEEKDAPLIDRMKELIESGQQSGPNPAALAVVELAAGNGTLDSKVRRLERRYLEVHGDNGDR